MDQTLVLLNTLVKQTSRSMFARSISRESSKSCKHSDDQDEGLIGKSKILAEDSLEEEEDIS